MLPTRWQSLRSSWLAALNPVRLVDASPLIEVKEGEARAVLYAAILKRAQAELKKKGMLGLEPDGVFNPETRAALQVFQTQIKLPPDWRARWRDPMVFA